MYINHIHTLAVKSNLALVLGELAWTNGRLQYILVPKCLNYVNKW